MKNVASLPMARDRGEWTRLLDALAFAGLFTFLTLALMIANTWLLGVGDPKFRVDGWRIYWPMWSVAFSPAVLATIIVTVVYGQNRQSSWSVYLTSLGVILIALEESALLDTKWPALLTELVVLCSLTVVLSRRHLTHDS